MITIVIPTYNRASVLEKTIDSVLSQTFSDWECLIVDDFSTDNTKEVVKYYCEKDSRFRYLINERKKGAQGARNTGILNAKGEYVSFLDSDDHWNPLMLDKQIEQYRKNKNVGFVYSNIQFISPNGLESEFGIPFGIQGDIYSKALEQGYIAPTSVISAKRDLLKQVGMFDETLPASQDDDLCFKLAKKSTVAFIPEVMAYMHINSNNRISDNALKVALGWWLLWNKYENDVVVLCGKETMAKHYRECLHHFIQAQNANMSRRAYHKFIYFGGRLSKRKKIWLCAFILTGGKNKYITHKLQKKI